MCVCVCVCVLEKHCLLSDVQVMKRSYRPVKPFVCF